MERDLQPSPVERASYPAARGNRVRVLIDGARGARRAISAAFASARALDLDHGVVRTSSTCVLAGRRPAVARTLLDAPPAAAWT